MKTLTTTALILLFHFSFSQNGTFYLQSWKSPTHINKIKHNTSLQVSIVNPDTVTIGKSAIVNLFGKNVMSLENELVFETENYLLEKKIASGKFKENENILFMKSGTKVPRTVHGSLGDSASNALLAKFATYNHDKLVFSLDSLSNASSRDYKIIPIKNIDLIMRWEGSTLNTITNFGIVASIVSGLVAAPLVSINYKTGAINQQTYYSVLAASGLCFAISLPLNIIAGKGSKYKIKPVTPTPTEKNYYNIQTKN